MKFLQDTLEEEHSRDRDYHLSKDTIDFLKQKHGDKELLRLLEENLDKKQQLEIEWRREISSQ